MPSHRLMRETLANGGPDGGPRTAELAAAGGRPQVGGGCRRVLRPAGRAPASLDIWETEYLQVLEGADPVLEWVKGTGLRPILNGLGRRRARDLRGGVRPPPARRLSHAGRRPHPLPVPPPLHRRDGVAGPRATPTGPREVTRRSRVRVGEREGSGPRRPSHGRSSQARHLARDRQALPAVVVLVDARACPRRSARRGTAPGPRGAACPRRSTPRGSGRWRATS